ncbi:hypothetical protein ACNQVK_24720 [Mycobacterium sp. 134]|uniref:hypothetical protein n=1 Tax=Mycobacterium sp. 134 TaxID=3400425 RepID=UPI003AAF9565
MHALVIGVSEYEGDRFKLLRGAAPAATHFARFLLHDFHHPEEVPLQTVRLHLAPPANMTEADQAEYLLTDGRPYQPASYQAVERALAAWAADCDAHPGNIAVLFVTGHGLATSSQARWAFLPEAGAAGNIYSFGINVTALKQRMEPRRARTQLFIWDICADSDGKPDYDGTGGISIPPVTHEPEHPGSVDQVAIMSRLGTETYALNAEKGTVLTSALVGFSAEDFRTRLMCTAVAVDKHSNIAVTPKQVEKLLPAAVDSKVRGHPSYMEHIVDSRSADVGLNRPDPPPLFKVTLSWNGQPASEALSIKVTRGRDETFPTYKLVWTADQPEVQTLVELSAGHYQFSAKPCAGDGNSYGVTVDSDMSIDAWNGGEL